MAFLFFGGSFNPIHHGHLICSRAVAERAAFERVVLVPSPQPPHKPGPAGLAAAEHRLEMCRLAVQGSPLFEVDDLELSRPGPSYTLETARQLRQRGIDKVNWLIGGDMLAILPQWHRPQELLREVRLIIMARPGWSFDWDRLGPEYQHLRHQVVQAPQIDISASDIRQRVAAGLAIDYLTTQAVCQYIHTHDLYAGPT